MYAYNSVYMYKVYSFNLSKFRNEAQEEFSMRSYKYQTFSQFFCGVPFQSLVKGTLIDSAGNKPCPLFNRCSLFEIVRETNGKMI